MSCAKLAFSIGAIALAAGAMAIACGAPSTPPSSGPPTFACGKTTCDASASYCERQLSDVPSVPNVETCKPLPGPCRNARDCSCFPIDTPCMMFKKCSEQIAGDRVGLTMTCPGG